jgi:hypothetical protein
MAYHAQRQLSGEPNGLAALQQNFARRMHRIGRVKEKEARRPLFHFHSPSDWPTYSLPKRYEMKRHPSTGKISYFGLIFHEKMAGRVLPGPV